MSYRTQLHIVETLPQALEVAHEMRGVNGIGLDLEGIVIPYIGNSASRETIDTTINKFDGSFRKRMLLQDIRQHPDTKYGIMTNNTNTNPPAGQLGVVERMANKLEIPYVHKGLNGGLYSSEDVKGKPSGHQGRVLARILDVDPANMVLIDDQGIKNLGEAVNAGFKAIIVPKPIGDKNRLGRIKEHKGVMLSRIIEGPVYRSMKRNGRLADFVLSKMASGTNSGAVKSSEVQGPFSYGE